MKRIAVFPGQGSQQVGMGRALHDQIPAAREVFAEVDEALGEKLSLLIFEGPAEELTLTRNAQPALMATSLAAVRALEAALGCRLGEAVDYVAGHSLGEYSALAAAGAISVGEAARLLRLRGEAMQRAVPAGEGAMAAILGLGHDQVEAVAADAAHGEVCELANDNSDGQAVVSGHRTAVERAVQIAKEKGARRSMLLQVSAPFHCALMAPAASELAPALAAAGFVAPLVPLIANVTATPVSDPAQIADLLRRQVTARVRWRETMARMHELGAGAVIELGAGKVLTGLAKRGVAGANLFNVQEPDDVAALAAALGAGS
ncbi:ACP S-malonyltransferase [Marinimicrococcus flavescens]|uniref:Malonyl CoA-acyl carrier protein transacylase n=1 Tax=Marinimicrococcus flavescens TaxID=3031815 RepID=A0AAP3UZH5_9PROT|nr:ACP S-malonyltransferase [Marinimicrococcus flavescens]